MWGERLGVFFFLRRWFNRHWPMSLVVYTYSLGYRVILTLLKGSRTVPPQSPPPSLLRHQGYLFAVVYVIVITIVDDNTVCTKKVKRGITLSMMIGVRWSLFWTRVSLIHWTDFSRLWLFMSLDSECKHTRTLVSCGSKNFVNYDEEIKFLSLKGYS